MRRTISLLTCVLMIMASQWVYAAALDEPKVEKAAPAAAEPTKAKKRAVEKAAPAAAEPAKAEKKAEDVKARPVLCPDPPCK